MWLVKIFVCHIKMLVLPLTPVWFYVGSLLSTMPFPIYIHIVLSMQCHKPLDVDIIEKAGTL